MSRLARVFTGRAEDVLLTLPAECFDSIVTDPPYGLEFMSVGWDTFKEPKGGPRLNPRSEWQDFGSREHPRTAAAAARVQRNKSVAFQRWCEAWARECFRVLKPGGYLVAFGGTRTYHRLACAVEDAGFEVRDSLHWIYGSGFPKSRDIGKAIDKEAGVKREVVGSKSAGQSSLQRVARVEQGYRENLTACTPEDIPVTAPAPEEAARWDGWGTALKPAHEPIILARKPLSEGTVAGNVLRWGTGALNVGGCKVSHISTADLAESQGKNRHSDFGSGPRDNKVFGADERARADQGNYDGSAGRWPPNLLLTHSAGCQLAGTQRGGREGDYQIHMPETAQAWACAPDCPVAGMDTQSGISKSSGGKGAASGKIAANVYGDFAQDVAGANAGGLGDTGGASRFFPQFAWSPEYDLPFLYQAKAGKKERPVVEGLPGHPTVKPLALMRWLARLVTPPGGTVLEPFAGTGPTVQAALDEGFRCVAIERDPDSVRRIRVRLHSYPRVGYSPSEPEAPAPGSPEEAA